MQYEAAKPKGISRNEDAPRQEPMRGSDSQVRRNPSTDQKKVRRQMAKKASELDAFSVRRGVCKGEGCGVAMAMPDKSNQELCPNCLDRQRRDVAADQDKSFFDQTKASRKTAGYDSLSHPDAWSMNESVIPMKCYECEEDYDAPAVNGIINSDECPNCGSDATYQKGKKNTFAEDAREDWSEQDPHSYGSYRDTTASRKTAGGDSSSDSIMQTFGPEGGPPKGYRLECTDCKGSGIDACPDCDGTGKDKRTWHGECEECDGAGGYYCDTCNGSGWGVPQPISTLNKNSRKTAGLDDIVGRTDSNGDPNCLHCAYDKGNAEHFEGSQPILRKDLEDYAVEVEDSERGWIGMSYPKCENCGDDIEEAADKAFKLRAPRKTPGYKATSSRKTATQFDTRADKLNPGQHVRTPTGGTTQVRRVRNHESSGKHVYVDTDLGTTLVPREDSFEVVPQNARQQELPGYGVPGGTSNTLPADPKGPAGTNTSPSSSCPVCGSNGTLRRSGDHYACSKCGYQESFGGPSDKNYSSSQQVIRTFTNKNNNRRTASVIARRAQQVLDLEENQ